MNPFQSPTEARRRTDRSTKARPGVEGLEGRLAPSGTAPWGAFAALSMAESSVQLELIKFGALVQRQQAAALQITTSIQKFAEVKAVISAMK